MIFNANLRGNKTDIIPNLVKNIISLKLKQEEKDFRPYSPNNYEICMKIDISQQKQKAEKELINMSEEEKEKIIKQASQSNETSFEDDNQVRIKAIVTQTNSINVLPSDTDSIVKGNSTYVIHSGGEFILDLFSCKNDAKLKFSNSLNKIAEMKSKSLEAVSGASEQKHAVQVSETEMTFINI